MTPDRVDDLRLGARAVVVPDQVSREQNAHRGERGSASMTKVYDPLEGVTAETKKDELMERLRRAAAMLRREDNQNKKRVAEIEDRLRAKYDGQSREQLKSAIVSQTEAEWKELVEFLEEFEDLLPVGGLRIVQGGRILLKLIPTEPDAEVKNADF